MGVLNFAHGSFLTISAFLGWEVGRRVSDGTWWGLAVSALVGMVVGAIVAALTEYLLIRRLYERHIEQALVTVGLALATRRALRGHLGHRPDLHRAARVARPRPPTLLGAKIPNDRFLLIACALLVLGGIVLFLRRTRYGLIIRAGVENRSMVDRARHRRAPFVHDRLRDRRRRRRARRCARLGVLRLRLGAPRLGAAHLRVHRHRDRGPRLAHRAPRSHRCSWPCCSSSPTSTSAAPATSSSSSRSPPCCSSARVDSWGRSHDPAEDGCRDIRPRHRRRLPSGCRLGAARGIPSAGTAPRRRRGGTRRAARRAAAARDRHPGRPARPHVHARHAAAARVRDAHRGPRAELPHDVRPCGAAVVRARAVLRRGRLRTRHHPRRVRSRRVAERADLRRFDRRHPRRGHRARRHGRARSRCGSPASRSRWSRSRSRRRARC